MILPTVLAIMAPLIAAIRLQDLPSFLHEDDRHVPMTGQPLGSDEPFLAEVAQVA